MLSVKRKSDRAAMVADLARVATEHGATVEIEAEPGCFLGKRANLVQIRAPRGLCLNVGIDGSSELGNTHVLSWFIPHNFDTRLAVTFAPSVNEFHFHKATDVAYDFKELLAIVALRLNSAANGSAFQD